MTADKSTYVVLYSGYNETEKVTAKDIRPVSGKALKAITNNSNHSKDSKKKAGAMSGGVGEKRPLSSAEHQGSKASKKVHKAQEHESKQNNWLKFSAKAVKTGKIPQKSIFSTPDTIGGKVGVTNSGQGMTGKKTSLT